MFYNIEPGEAVGEGRRAAPQPSQKNIFEGKKDLLAKFWSKYNSKITKFRQF
jgi:hypothetical protein